MSFKEYYDNGQIKSEGVQIESCYSGEVPFVPKGLWKYYHKNGKLESEGEFRLFVDCTSRGSGRSIVEDDHDICVECVLGNTSRKIGKWKYYHENGKLKIEGVYLVRDFIGLPIVKNGLWKYYYPNGKLKMVGEYNGLDNSVEDWDVRCGVWKTYDKNGNLSNKLTYKNGEIV